VAQDEREEIEEAVGQALSRMGISGTISIGGDTIELRADGPPVGIEIDLTLKQWPLLPPEMRRRKADDIARRVAEAYRASQYASRATGEREGPPPARIAGGIAAVFGVLALIGVARMVIPRLTIEKKPDATTPSEADGARRDRLARACDAMRDRLYKGASFGPFATEGWVVELWLAARKGGTMRADPALTGAIAGGKLTAAADDELSRVSDGTVEIVDGFSDDLGRRSPAWGGAVMVFHEGYARVFLEPETRQRFILLADRLADASGADAGALYARCAHLQTHDIGAWYRGKDAPGAAAAMVYQMGFFADGTIIDRGAVTALRAPGGDLDALGKAAAAVEPDLLGKMVSAQGGSVNTAHGVSLVFPLAGPTRAQTATRALARRMGVGIGSD
jgi:serine/threonine-protein kinase